MCIVAQNQSNKCAQTTKYHNLNKIMELTSKIHCPTSWLAINRTFVRKFTKLYIAIKANPGIAEQYLQGMGYSYSLFASYIPQIVIPSLQQAIKIRAPYTPYINSLYRNVLVAYDIK